MSKDQQFESGFAYTAHHIPSKEDWYILGINIEKDKVCAAGWPASIGNLSDCVNFEKIDKLTETELRYREKTFGTNWI